MFCKNCGRQIPDDAASCPACGSKRLGGMSGGEGSERNIRSLPDYAKEKDLDRSGNAVDTNRQRFSLSDPGQKKFSLSDAGQKKFSLADSGQKKFSLSDKGAKTGDDIVRVSVNGRQDAPRKAPTGFVNPLKDSGKTVFHDKPADAKPAAAPERPAPPEPVVDDAAIRRPAQQTERPAPAAPDVSGAEGAPDGQPGERTGFVNPLKDSGQDIHWGSDGDRSELKNAEVVGDPAEIDSHMGFAILTLICCCQPTSVLAIIFAAMVSQEVKKGNYEQARKYSNLANIFCWVSIGLSIFCGGISSLSNLGELSARLNATGTP